MSKAAAGNSRLLITVTEEIRNKVEAKAKDEDRSISNMVSRILEEYFKNIEQQQEQK